MASLGMLTILVDDYDRGLAYFTRTLGFALVEDTFLSPEERWVVIAPDVNQGMLQRWASRPVEEWG
jgi:catechol 2,3-dioxygenase-like lactoylglutathione lyase family enzyme